jgi:hypothetical protein
MHSEENFYVKGYATGYVVSTEPLFFRRGKPPLRTAHFQFDEFELRFMVRNDYAWRELQNYLSNKNNRPVLVTAGITAQLYRAPNSCIKQSLSIFNVSDVQTEISGIHVEFQGKVDDLFENYNREYALIDTSNDRFNSFFPLNIQNTDLAGGYLNEGDIIRGKGQIFKGRILLPGQKKEEDQPYIMVNSIIQRDYANF